MAQGEQPRPYLAYATLTGTFLGSLALTAALGARLRRAPASQTPFEFMVLMLATFKAARTLSHDEVTSFIREPFVRETGDLTEVPVRNGGFRQAAGELVTCSRCIGTWVAAGMTAADLLAPRFARPVNSALALAGANDFLQGGFAALSSAANRLQS